MSAIKCIIAFLCSFTLSSPSDYALVFCKDAGISAQFITLEKESGCNDFSGRGVDQFLVSGNRQSSEILRKRAFDSLYALVSSPKALLHNIIDDSVFINRNREVWNDSNFRIAWKIGLLFQERLRNTRGRTIRGISAVPIRNSLFCVLTYGNYERDLVYLDSKGRIARVDLTIPRLIDTAVFVNQDIELNTINLQNDTLDINLQYVEFVDPLSTHGMRSNVDIIWQTKKNRLMVTVKEVEENEGGDGGCLPDFDCSKVNREFNPFSDQPNQNCIEIPYVPGDK